MVDNRPPCTPGPNRERLETVDTLQCFRIQVDLVECEPGEAGLPRRAAKGLAKALERNGGKLDPAIEEVLSRWA